MVLRSADHNIIMYTYNDDGNNERLLSLTTTRNSQYQYARRRKIQFT
jgi:hypothetical protein